MSISSACLRRFVVVVCAIVGTACTTPALGQGGVLHEDWRLRFKMIEQESFGASLSINDGIVAIGAPGDDTMGLNRGSVYLFDEATGEQLAKIFPEERTGFASFGRSVAIDDGVLVVGANFSDSTGWDYGVAFLFDVDTGEQIARLQPKDLKENDYFGYTVAIDAGLAVVSGWNNISSFLEGGIYVFEARTGKQITRLRPPEGQFSDSNVGRSVAFENGIVAVGVSSNDEKGRDAGSVYLFDATTGSLIRKLYASEAQPYDYFGSGLAMKNGVVVAGAHVHSQYSTALGSVYLFDVNTGEQIARHVALESERGKQFGGYVEAGDGVFAATVGEIVNGKSRFNICLYDIETGLRTAKLSPSRVEPADLFSGHFSLSAGSLGIQSVVFDESGDSSTLVNFLDDATGNRISELYPNGDPAGDEFGISIAADDGRIVVGAPGHDGIGLDHGAAYVHLSRHGYQFVKLLPRDGATGDRFGQGVALEGEIVAVGAPFDDDSGTDSGSVYLFDAVSGDQLAKLLATDVSPGDQFGSALDLDDGVLAAGASASDHNGTDSGAVYLFETATGTQSAILLPDDARRGDNFGNAVAIDTGVVAVGAWGDGDNGRQSGSVYLFDASTSAQLIKVLPEDGRSRDRFGASVAIADGLLAVGAPGTDDNGSDSGSAYLFDLATGEQLAKLLPSDGSAGDNFGESVSIADGVIAVGASRSDDSGESSGSAYLFEAASGAQLVKLTPTDSVADARFGSAIAMDAQVVAVGAALDTRNGPGAGAGYQFTAPFVGCRADTNADGVVDTGDISVFVSLFLIQNESADMNGDGYIDLGDIATFVTLFLAGC